MVLLQVLCGTLTHLCMQKSLRNTPSFNHNPLNDIWTLDFKFQAQKWIMSRIFPSFLSSSMNLPFPHLNIFSETQAILAEQKKAPFIFWRKASKSEPLRQDRTCSLILHILTDLFSLSLVFLLQLSLFVLNFHWDQQKVFYHTLLFANRKFGMFKHFPLNVYSDCGKAESLGNFSKIASAIWRNSTKGRSRYEVI